MFLRKTKAKGHSYLQIVESYRKEGKPKQRVLFSLGRVELLVATGQLDGLVAALSRFCEKQTWVNLAKDVSFDRVYYLGVADVTRRLMERTGLWKTLERIAGAHERLSMPWLPVVWGMILGRFVEPCSKRRLALEWWGRIYPDLLGIKEPELHWLYRAMDVLYAHRQEIERALFDRNGERDLFNQQIDVVFYDTTTLYFESTRTDKGEVRRFGYSKEHRSDCVQVVLGLLIDKDGIPVGYELFPGNTYDGKSVPKILEKLKTKYQVGRIIFVADRGMLSRDNIREIEAAKLEFVLGMRLQKAGAEKEAEFYDLARYRPVGKKGELLIREVEHEGRRLVLTWSQERADRDARTRELILENIGKKLSKEPSPRQLVTHRGYRQFVRGLEEGKPEIDAEAVELSKRRDGFYGVITNVAREKMATEEVYARYKDLWRIEDAFGEMKGTLRTRPIFHWTDERIEAHILICLLAYYIEAVITKTLREKKADFTAPTLFRALNEIYAVPVQARGTTAWVRNDVLGVAAKGYRLLGVPMPARVMKIEKKGGTVSLQEESEAVK